MGFKIEARTQEWFDLAVERELPATITPEDAGAELRALAREERPAVVLKAWEDHDLLEAVNPVLAKKRPGYDAINRLSNVAGRFVYCRVAAAACDAHAAGNSRAA